jgi:L,D-peptidoglycan transpeptidase YkuD (ErfK/YbiS/YcfS/YnhG family)
VIAPGITVRREGAITIAEWGRGPKRCAVGEAGIGEKHIEGDRITPVGRWPLRRIFYRADRLARPRADLPVSEIAMNDGWCDAPGDPNYNRLVKLPYPASAEELWRRDALYDIVVVVGYNDAPVVQGKGSAIFLHVASPNYGPTAGCVALTREDLLDALVHLGPNPFVEILA